jgi:glycosyltransferase involved in cell wall biosynthesis
MNQIPLTVVVITKNEESNITRCLTSVLGWVGEVVVYDSGSVDQTVQVASKLGARVVSGEWLGFGPTKKKATLLANNDWILSLDADEEVSLGLKNEILQRFSSLDSESAYALPRKSYFLKKWILHGGWYPDRQVRLFNQKHSMWNQDLIHEKVQAKSLQNFKNCLNHYVFKNLSHQVVTNDRYSTLQAQKMFNDGKKMNWFHFLTKPTVKFIECYFLKLGFLDGYAGYVIARSAAYSVFLKWAKLKELWDLK